MLKTAHVSKIAAILAMMLLAGCEAESCVVTEHEVTLRPSRIGSLFARQTSRSWWPFCIYTRGLGPRPSEEGEAAVGYSHTYDEDTFCWESNNLIYQGVVRFPVLETTGPSTLVRRAVLHFDLGRHEDSANEGPSCAVSICGTEDGSWLRRGREGLVDTSVCVAQLAPGRRSFTIDVTPLAQSWVNLRRPNNGIVIVGSKTSFDQFSDRGMLTEQECISWYRNFTLDVEFLRISR